MMRILDARFTIWCLCYGFSNTHYECALTNRLCLKKIQKCSQDQRAREWEQKSAWNICYAEGMIETKVVSTRAPNTHTQPHFNTPATLLTVGERRVYARALPSHYHHLRMWLHALRRFLCFFLRSAAWFGLTFFYICVERACLCVWRQTFWTSAGFVYIRIVFAVLLQNRSKPVVKKRNTPRI